MRLFSTSLSFETRGSTKIITPMKSTNTHAHTHTRLSMHTRARVLSVRAQLVHANMCEKERERGLIKVWIDSRGT